MSIIDITAFNNWIHDAAADYLYNGITTFTGRINSRREGLLFTKTPHDHPSERWGTIAFSIDATHVSLFSWGDRWYKESELRDAIDFYIDRRIYTEEQGTFIHHIIDLFKEGFYFNQETEFKLFVLEDEDDGPELVDMNLMHIMQMFIWRCHETEFEYEDNVTLDTWSLHTEALTEPFVDGEFDWIVNDGEMMIGWDMSPRGVEEFIEEEED